MANSGRLCKWCMRVIEFRDGYWRVVGETTRYCSQHDGRHEPISGESSPPVYGTFQEQPFGSGNMQLTGGASAGEQPPQPWPEPICVCGIRKSARVHDVKATGEPETGCHVFAARPVSGTEPQFEHEVDRRAQTIIDANPGTTLTAAYRGVAIDSAAAGGTEESAGPRVPQIEALILDIYRYRNLWDVPDITHGSVSLRNLIHKHLAAAPSLTPRPKCPKCGGPVVLRHVLSSCPSFCGVQCPRCLPEATWFINSIDDLAQFFSAQEAGQ